MARYKPPQHPDESRKREEQAQRIAAIGQQLNAPLRDLSNQLTSLTQEIHTNNEERQRSEEDYNERHLFWVIWSAISSGIFSFFSLGVAAMTLYMLNNQLVMMRVDQRAWVGIVEASIQPRQAEGSPQVKAGSPIRFGAVITNSGKTPALKVKSAVGASSIPREDKFTPVYADPPPPGGLPSQGVLFPGVHADGRAGPMSLTQEQVNDVRSGDAILYVFGKLEYQDVFGGPHCTTFCLRFSPDFSGAPACNTYNDVTDGKCEE